MRASRPGTPIKERIERLIERRPDGCWWWIGARAAWGYGIMSVNRHVLRAHRAVYEAYVGPIPDGLTLDHLCRTPRCVNPAHLEPVTMRENVLRGATIPAANARRTHCSHGHPYNEQNTRYRGNRRECRVCDRDRWRVKSAQRRQQLAA